jgi:hypothetical protein
VLNIIKKQLSVSIDTVLVERLLRCYVELKQNYYLGKHKPSELDSAHFSEVVIRILQYVTSPGHTFTSLGTRLSNFDREVARFAQLPSADFHDSVRLHIPRALQAIYGIRSRRGVAHVGGDVNPNLSDSTFVMATCDWIMTEFIRLYYTSSLEEAQKLVDSIIERKVTIIQNFSGYLKVLNPKLRVPNKILVLLYYRGEEGASTKELQHWVKTKSTSHISTALTRLEHEKGYIHCDNSRCFITRTGIRFVEENIPLQL